MLADSRTRGLADGRCSNPVISNAAVLRIYDHVALGIEELEIVDAEVVTPRSDDER